MKKKFINPVIECIYTRRSIRKYKNKKVPKKIISEILNAGIMAPSAMNRQPWRFIIIRNKKIIQTLADISAQECTKNKKLKKYNINFSKKMIFYNAPLLILVCGKRKYDWLKEDTNLAVQNMFLAAHSLGLGSCWIGFAKPLDKNKKARKILKINDNPDLEIVAPLIFGYPLKEKTLIPKRKPDILKWIE